MCDSIALLIKAKIIKSDLMTLNEEFNNNGILSNTKNIIMLKYAFITMSNLYDFEPEVRHLHDDIDIKQLFHSMKKDYEFIQYIRNKFVGHLQVELINKAIEWQPFLKYNLSYNNQNSPDAMDISNLWLLETTVNTYVKPDEKHKIFNSDSDFHYPPDLKRFNIFLYKNINNGINYLDIIIKTLEDQLQLKILTLQEQLIDARHSGMTTFKYISKKGR